jgi:predicted lysophospholipase L1 biosynthesis ABC-type transport system permease subunit
MQMIVQLQVIIGCVVAIFTITASAFAAFIVVAGSFKRDWPPDWFFSNLVGVAAILAIGFGLAEGFLAFTRYAIGS